MDKGFLRKATPEEQEIVKQYETGFARKETVSGIRIIAFLIFAGAYMFYYFNKDPKEMYAGIIICVILSVFMIFVIRSLIIGIRHKKKINNGEYMVRVISVLERSDEAVGYDLYKVVVSSEHGNKTELEVDSSLRRQMLKGMTGILVAINDEEKHLFNNQYRFIPSSEYPSRITRHSYYDDDTEYIPDDSDDSFEYETLSVPFRTPTDTDHSIISGYLSRRIKKIVIKILICTVLFALALAMMYLGSLRQRPEALYLEIPGLIISAGLLFFMLNKVMRDNYNGKQGVWLISVLGLLAHLFAIPFVLGLVNNTPIDRLIFAAAAFILSFIFSFLLYKDEFRRYTKVGANEYEVMPGRIETKESEIRHTYRRSITLYYVVVRNAAGQTIRFNDVDQSLYKTCREGGTVLIVLNDRSKGSDPDQFFVPADREDRQE